MAQTYRGFRLVASLDRNTHKQSASWSLPSRSDSLATRTRRRSSAVVNPGFVLRSTLRVRDRWLSQQGDQLHPSRHGMTSTARILIVDDDVEARRSLAQQLRECGYEEIRSEGSAAAALEAAVSFDPRIILLDIDLPDMSGYDVARFLHQHPRLQQMRLIALTNHGEHPGREQARESGFERYLVKPVSAAALHEMLAVASR